MPSSRPGRNEPCPCGSGRKFKQCCLQSRVADDSARVRLRGAEGRVVGTLLDFTARTWGAPLVTHAWEDFWVYDDVPDDMRSVPEFDTMFVPWLVLGFVPDPEADGARENWPTQPIGLEWLATERALPDLDRLFIEKACRSPLSVYAVEQVTSQRSVDLKDVLTGRLFHVLEQGASQRLRPADLLFARVLTVNGSSIMFGASPFIVPPRWHTHIIDWRELIILPTTTDHNFDSTAVAGLVQYGSGARSRVFLRTVSRRTRPKPGEPCYRGLEIMWWTRLIARASCSAAAGSSPAACAVIRQGDADRPNDVSCPRCT